MQRNTNVASDGSLKTTKQPKRLSLTAHVFLLLGGFLLVLSALQILFITVIENKINKEISQKSAVLSSRAVDLVVTERFRAVEEVNKNMTLQVKQIRDKLRVLNEQESLPFAIDDNNKAVLHKEDGTIITIDFGSSDSNDDAEEVQQAKVQLEEILEKQKRSRLEMEELLKRNEVALERVVPKTQAYVQDLKDEIGDVRIIQSDSDAFELEFPKQGTTKSLFTFKRDEYSNLATYFNYLIFATLALALLSLLFAYFLAKRVTHPLRALSGGFKALSKGDFGKQIPTRGVNEVRETLTLFNQTSTRLASLQALEAKYAKQQQLAELGEISRGMAHSLRNPLNTIGLALDEMAQQSLDEQQRSQIAGKARSKIEALDRTIKSLLLLTTSGLDRSQQVSLNDVINDVALQMSSSSKCHINVCAEQSVSIAGSEAELTAVLSSLLSNAEEASDEGANISIRLAVSVQNILISIIDEGRGIDDETLTKLFSPSVTTKSEGAGMGLYIAKRILSLHYNGDLRLTNNLEAGCTATIELNTDSAKMKQDNE